MVNACNDKTTIIVSTICTNIFIKNYFSRSDGQADGGYTILELSIPCSNRHNNTKIYYTCIPTQWFVFGAHYILYYNIHRQLLLLFAAMFKYNQGRDRFVPDRHRSPYSFYSVHHNAENHQYDCVSNCSFDEPGSTVSTYLYIILATLRLCAYFCYRSQISRLKPVQRHCQCIYMILYGSIRITIVWGCYYNKSFHHVCRSRSRRSFIVGTRSYIGSSNVPR